MSMLQLDPIIPVDVEGFGKGNAHVLIDYGPEHTLLWVVFFDESRACVAVNNKDIRIQQNYSMKRWDEGRAPLYEMTPFKKDKGATGDETKG
jgi:hypothetical protein